MRVTQWLGCAVLLAGALAGAGCSTGHYSGMSPYVTSFKQDPDFPGFKENYYGATADFILDQDGTNPVVPHDADPTAPPVIRVNGAVGTTQPTGEAGEKRAN